MPNLAQLLTSKSSDEYRKVFELCREIGEELKPENSWRTTLHWDPDARAGWYKRFMLFWFGILPKSIL